MENEITPLQRKKDFLKLEVLAGCLCIANIAAAVMYLFVRVLLHDYVFSIREDVMNFGRTIAIASVIAFGIYVIVMIISAIVFLFSRKLPQADHYTLKRSFLPTLFSRRMKAQQLGTVEVFETAES